MTDGEEAVAKLRRYGVVRDRKTEKEPRTVTLTDDEAVALLEMLDRQEGER